MNIVRLVNAFAIWHEVAGRSPKAIALDLSWLLVSSNYTFILLD